MVIFSETNLDRDLNSSADQQKLEHKVIECSEEELEEGCASGRSFVVRSEGFPTSLEVRPIKTMFVASLELFIETVKT